VPIANGVVSVIKRWWSGLSNYERKILLWITPIAFLLRGIFVLQSLLHHPLAVQVDTFRYMSIANAHGFATWFDLNDPAGYPILLWLTGSTLTYYPWILLLQLALSTVTVILAWELARPYLSEKANAILAILITINPVSLFFSSQLMTETTFTFFFILSILILLRKIRKQNAVWWLILGGLLLSFATLIRPSSIVTIAILSIAFLIQVIRKRVSWQNAAAYAIAGWSLIFIYSAGLKVRYNYFGLSMKGNTTLSIYYSLPIMHSLGYSEQFIDSTIRALPIAEQYLDTTRADHIDGKEFARQHNALFYYFLVHYPLHVAKVHLMGVGQMLLWPSAGVFQLHRHFGLRQQNDKEMHERQFNEVFFELVKLRFDKVLQLIEGQLAHSSSIILIVWFIGALLPPITLLFAIVGLILFAKGRFSKSAPITREEFRSDRVYLYLIFFSYLFFIPQIAASTRFRMPIEPLLALFACVAVDWLRERQAAKHSLAKSSHPIKNI